MTKILCIIALLLCASLHVHAQIEKIFIKGDFYNKPLTLFIEELEQKHNIQFHYVNEVVKDVQLNGIIKNNTPLLSVLEILLKDKPISFTASQREIVLYQNDKKALKSVEKYFKLSGQLKEKN